MDITIQFRKIIKQKGGASLTDKISNRHATSPFISTANSIKEEIDFLQQEIIAYTRHYLRTSASISLSSTSNSYKASSSSNDDVSDEQLLFGATEIEEQLKDTMKHIEALKSTLTEVEEQNKKSSGQQQANHQRAYYHSIIMILFDSLQNVSKQFQSIRQVQLDSIRQKRKLFKAEVSDSVAEKLSRQQERFQQEDEVAEEAGEEGDDNKASSQQMQLLETENKRLLLDLTEMLEDAAEAERSALEISSLISLFNSKVSEQAEKIEYLHNSVSQATGHATQAAEILVAAKRRKQYNSCFSFMWNNFTTVIILFLTFSLLFFDFILG